MNSLETRIACEPLDEWYGQFTLLLAYYKSNGKCMYLELCDILWRETDDNESLTQLICHMLL